MLSHQSKNEVDHLEKIWWKLWFGPNIIWVSDEDDFNESDKIPNHHLRFCPLGFIPHTVIGGCFVKRGYQTIHVLNLGQVCLSQDYCCRKIAETFCYLSINWDNWRLMAGDSFRQLSVKKRKSSSEVNCPAMPGVLKSRKSSTFLEIICKPRKWPLICTSGSFLGSNPPKDGGFGVSFNLFHLFRWKWAFLL